MNDEELYVLIEEKKMTAFDLEILTRRALEFFGLSSDEKDEMSYVSGPSRVGFKYHGIYVMRDIKS